MNTNCKNCGLELNPTYTILDVCHQKMLCAFRCYIKAVEETLAETYKDNPTSSPKVDFTEGRVNWKIISTVYGSRSVHSFVNRATGDVLKAASWNAPAKHARGNILNADFGRSALSDYGIKYLR